MNRLFTLRIVLLILTSSLLFSCSNHHDIPVWKITKENTPDSFMVGTIDYLDKTENGEIINAVIKKAFDSSSTYISQIDLKHSDFIITKQSIEIGMNRTLKDILSKDEFSKLSSLKKEWDEANSNSIPSPDSIKMRLLFYLQDIILSNNQENFYFEQFWMKQAMASQKNITGLETYQDFYKTLSEISLEDQINFMNSIGNFAPFISELRTKTSQCYFDGEYEKIHKLYQEKFNYNATNYARLFTQKHLAWVDKIKTELNEGNCFISLDITHLYGEDNFIDKLLSKGYKVEKIQ